VWDREKIQICNEVGEGRFFHGFWRRAGREVECTTDYWGSSG